jgi:hypothetical protein
MRIGLNELLRIFFNEPEPRQIQFIDEGNDDSSGLVLIDKFTKKYKEYYTSKYPNQANKYSEQIRGIPNKNNLFLRWLRDTLEKWEEQYKKDPKSCPEQEFDIERLLVNSKGERKLTFARFAIKFSLLKLIDDISNDEADGELEDELEELETELTL